jgi:hypothetical protein
MKQKLRKNNSRRIKNSVRVPAFVLIIAIIGLAVTWHRRNHFVRLCQNQQNRCRQCYYTALDVSKLLNAPHKATNNILTTNTIAKSLEQCAQKAVMPANAISRIVPSRPRRIPQSDYVECQTRVSLDNVQLKQFCHFLWSITNSITGLNINKLHIWFEPGQENLWQGEVTLAGISLVPRKNPRSNDPVTKRILLENK